ncbi:cytosine permease [Acinetobacter baumannii]|jgi:cytosine permease|uniref:Cytosine permease n=2 Tax=Acinetobacter TaxID=469 RepID=A0AB35V0J8_9GAMM|nr:MULTISPECIES: cytosine permease [Acinetobacter]AVI33876.1 permease for cytosine/purine, uracil, thiamine, allantoin family protein [Acinetobacter baumannii]AVI35970.1 permease for cytosine/purine, uracil, thiamine, allantoin family protein [Acinetobacter baumannii]EHU1451139.1 cytosine permease [Acinetobacter baumannii]EHU1568824.1 cytosine permease [Acinetobacter baumannii]EHU1624967.1 cytosine permease [Acinetobacter baumannii]
MSAHAESPLTETPLSQRKGFFPIALVLFSFTFFTGTMFAGGKIGVAFEFTDILWIVAIGNLLLGAYAATLGFISARSGLNTVLMGRFCFGNWGSKLSDFILGFAELGWFAWGTATLAISLGKILGFSDSLLIPLMVLFGLGFSITAIVGFKGLEYLSRVSIPLMFILLVTSIVLATKEIGGWTGLTSVQPTETLTLATAITMVFGTFASGATQITNWTRMSKSGKIAIWACLVSFVIGNGLMVLAGAWMAIVYQQPDIVEVLVLQGLSIAAVVMLCLNLWTIQGPAIYSVSTAACHMVRSERRKTMVLVAAVAGIILAAAGMYELLIPFLLLLGAIIPPLGGVIMADYWIRHKGKYPLLAEANIPNFNWIGLIAYFTGAIVAYVSPWIAPIVGIVVACTTYSVLNYLFPLRQESSVLNIVDAVE